MTSRGLQYVPWPIGVATIVIVATLVATGCQPETGPSTQNANPWLGHISQDTPVLLANEVPLDDVEFDRLAQTIQPLASLVNRDPQAHGAVFLHSVTTKLASAQDWRSAGLDPNGFWAMYVDNDRLIARIPLLDETAFWKTWIDFKAPPPAQMADPSASQTNDSPQRAIIQINSLGAAWVGGLDRNNPGWLVVETHGAWLSMWLQATHPDELSMITEQHSTASEQSNSTNWSAPSWRAFNQAHGLDGKVSAYVDLPGLVAQGASSDPNCQQAWSALDTQMPKLIMGTQDLSPESMTLLTRVMQPKGSSERPMPRPRIDVSEAQFAEVAGLGLIVDVATTRQALIDQLQQSQTALDGCSALSPLQPSQRWARGLSNRPVPPIITSIEGIMMRFDGLEPDDHSDKAMAHYLTEIYMQNPQFFIGLAGLFAPELAAMDLRANQLPQPLPPRLVEALGGVPIYLSTTQESLRVSSANVLDGSIQMTEPDSATLPWASGALNFNRLDELSAVMQAWPMTEQGQVLIDELTDWSKRADISRVQWLLQPSAEGVDLTIHTRH